MKPDTPGRACSVEFRSAPTPTRSKLRVIRDNVGGMVPLSLLAAAGFAVYVSGLNIWYYGDDFQYVFPAPSARILYFFLHKNPNHQFYRPVNASILAMIQTFIGLQTWPIHVINIVLHILTVWLVLQIALRLRLSSVAASLAALFMLVSQANAIAVLGNTRTSQLASTFFGLLSLWLLDGALLTETEAIAFQVGAYLLSLGMFSLALLSKETGVSFALLMLTLIAVRLWPRYGFPAVKKCAPLALPFVLLTLGYILLRAFVGAAPPQLGSGGYNFHLGSNVVTNLSEFALAAMVPLSTADVFVLFTTHQVLLSAAVVVVTCSLFALVVYGLWRSQARRIWVVIALLAILALFPAVLLVHISELYLYNAMPFIALLVGGGFGYYFASPSLRGGKFVVALVLAAVVLGTNIEGIRSKAALMKKNGERAARLITQLIPFLTQVPYGGGLVLLNRQSGTPRYSVYLMRDFDVFLWGENILNSAAKRDDFRVKVADPSHLSAEDFNNDTLVLTLCGNEVIRSVLPSAHLSDAAGGSRNVGPALAPASSTGTRFYSFTSFWNTPISSSPRIDPNSEAMMSYSILPYIDDTYFNYGNDWGIAFTVASSPDTLYSVTCTLYCEQGASFPMHIPAGTQPSTGSDHHLTVQNGNTEFDMWGASYDSTHNAWSALAVNYTSIWGWGAECPRGQHCNSSVAAGFAGMGGVIRPEEIQQGHVDHALSLVIPRARSKYIACPATHTDGADTSTYAIPEGAQLQLDPSYNVDVQPWPSWQKMIAKAAQKYGMYVSDQNGSGQLTWYGQTDQNPGNLRWSSVGVNNPKFSKFPWESVRVIQSESCN